MSTNLRPLAWKAAAAVSLAVAAVGAGLPAYAASGPNIDPNQLGSLTINKFVQPTPASAQPNTGTPVDTTGLTPLKGVEFTVQRVSGIDLSTNAGWTTTQGLTAATVMGDPTGYPLGAVTGGVITTDANGHASVGNLPLGVYLVTETGAGGNPISDMTAPFLVSVPLPQNGDSSWLYDVNVYPKNSVTALGKTVDDSTAHGIGDEVDWTITAAVPAMPAGQGLSKFVITDPVDTRLNLTGVTVSLTSSTGGSVALDPSYYTITPAGGAMASPSDDVVVTFTPAGLTFLTGYPNGTVSVKVATTVQALGADGAITDQATVDVNGYDGQTPKTETQWGALQIVKVAQGDSTKLLQGAQFQVFLSEADARATTNPVASGGASTFSTDANGQVVVPGLKIEDGQQSTDYWIVETAAPTGYQLDSTPIKVTVTPGATADAAVQQVSDSQVQAFMLPLTGSTGTVIYTVGGIALVLVGIALVVIVGSRRRREAASQQA